MPGASAIGRLEQSAAAAVKFVRILPRAFAYLPYRRINRVRIRWVDFNIASAGVFIFRNDFLPILAAVGRAIDASFFARSVRMPEDSGEHAGGIARIDGQRGNLLRIIEAEMFPGLARIRRFVDSISYREIGTMQSFAAAHKNNVWIGWRNGNRSDRLRRLVVENRIPGASVVVRFPDSAIDLTYKKNVGLACAARSGASAPAAKRSDHAPMQFLISAFWNLTPTGAGGKKNGAYKQTEDGV